MTTKGSKLRSITVYSLPNCVQCGMTKRWLDRAGINFTPVDLSQSPEDAAMVSALGYRQAPVVIITDGDADPVHWSGFDPDLLAHHAGQVAA